jgi:hypothetical protein
VIAEVERHFEDQVVLLAALDEGVRRRKRRVQRGQLGALEAHVHDGAHDGGDGSEVLV